MPSGASGVHHFEQPLSARADFALTHNRVCFSCPWHADAVRQTLCHRARHRLALANVDTQISVFSIDDPNFVRIHLDLLETVDAPTPVRATDDVPWRLPFEGAVERLQSIDQRQQRSTAITQ